MNTDIQHAPIGTRVVATCIDGFCTVLALIPGLVLVVLDPNFHDRSADAEPGMLGIIGVLLMGLVALALCGLQWFLMSTRGQSLGKIATRIHIRKVDGSAVDFATAVVLRSWLIGLMAGVVNMFSCGFLGWIVSVVDVLFVVDGTYQCLHDRLAKTYVLQGHPPELGNPAPTSF